MTWSALTSPPPSRPPAPKHPLFTTKVFSTKSFGPGHIVGAGLLVFGLVGMTKFFAARTRSDAAPPKRSGNEPKLVRAENARGEYGRRP